MQNEPFDADKTMLFRPAFSAAGAGKPPSPPPSGAPLELRQIFEEWLNLHYPERAARVLALVRQTRGGKLYDARFGQRQTGEGAYAELLAQRFRVALRRLVDALRIAQEQHRITRAAERHAGIHRRQETAAEVRQAAARPLLPALHHHIARQVLILRA